MEQPEEVWSSLRRGEQLTHEEEEEEEDNQAAHTNSSAMIMQQAAAYRTAGGQLANTPKGWKQLTELAVQFQARYDEAARAAGNFITNRLQQCPSDL
jgi:hypothetical protein